jgi:hypothetical protein
MRLSLDVEGGVFEVAVGGTVVGRIDAVGKRTQSSFEISPSKVKYDTTWDKVEITALSPLRPRKVTQAAAADVVDDRHVSGRFFDIQWRDASL